VTNRITSLIIVD